MNKDNYKAIAKIIKKEIIELSKFEETDIRINQIFECKLIAERLADYFEKEDNKRAVNITHRYPEAHKLFNREQFLKQAGVE